MSSERAPTTVSTVVDAIVVGWNVLARNERTLWTVALVAGGADVLLTFYGLENGLIERNPLARESVRRIGYGSLVAVKALAVGLGLAWLPVLPERYAGIVPVCLAVPWTIAASINAALIVLVL